MDPTGGMGLWVLIGVLVAIILMWVFAPFEWALSVTIGLAVLFVAFVVFVFSNARFT